MTEDKNKKLFLLDAYALIYRAYYAFIKNPRVNSKGQNTSAVFGFLLALEDILQNQRPTHIAVVFDPPTPTFRHIMFPEYKANRDETPEDIKLAVPYVKRLITGLGIPVIQVDGFEADDVIGTLARQASERGFTTFMMTPDKDFAQLVTENVVMYKPSRSGDAAKIWGVEDVKREFSVERPEQVIDLLALMGDSSDNIPGAPGIGPKTAQKLLAEYDTVENLISESSRLSGKVKDIIENNVDQILLSKKLATIEQFVNLDFDEESITYGGANKQALKQLFDELEFRTASSRLLASLPESLTQSTDASSMSTELSADDDSLSSRGTPDDLSSTPRPERSAFSPPPSAQGSLFESVTEGEVFIAQKINDITNTTHDYRLAQTMSEVRALADTISGIKEFCFDTETTDINPLEARLVAIAFSWEKGSGFLVSFDGTDTENLEKLNILKPVFTSGSLKVGHNLKFDIQVLGNYGIRVEGPLFDTMLAHYLLEPDMRHKMDYLAEAYLGYRPVPIESLIGSKGSNQRSMSSVPLKDIVEYAVEDADVTWQLYKYFAPRLKEEGLMELAETIEMPLIQVLADIERRGVCLNTADLKSFAAQLREEIIVLEKEIYFLAGHEFNIASPRQLGDILFLRLKLDSDARKTKTGQYSTNEEILQRLAHKHPIVDKVLEFRGLSKLLSTYVESLPALISKSTGRIHTSFNQAVASTGRLSSNNPNMQNIPVRDEAGREIRKAFVPADGYLFLSADYSQIELRLMAHLSNDNAMIADFESGSDIHAATASKIFGVPLDQVSREMRARAKTANFGIIYGISSFGLAERLTIGRKEAKELIDGYFASYPGVKVYMDNCIKSARERGYVTTMFGRKRYLPDINSRNQVVRGNAERNAINAPIQGSAADIIKIAMIRIHRRLEKEFPDTHMILQVHDELIFEVRPSDLERVRKMVTDEMSGAAELKVRMVIDSGTGTNWLEAH
ncbi:MAG: DNA polymerase I [Bacteroidales bacterium]|nr:DNA polymerase I [Bacteroidales bacterium]